MAQEVRTVEQQTPATREAGAARVEHAVAPAGRQVIGLDPDQWRHVHLGGKILLIERESAIARSACRNNG